MEEKQALFRLAEILERSIKGAREVKEAAPGIISLDLHGLYADEAKALIDKTLSKAAKSTYILRLIHGYHRGDSIRRMIFLEYGQGLDRRVIRVRGGSNPGTTDLILREL